MHSQSHEQCTPRTVTPIVQIASFSPSTSSSGSDRAAPLPVNREQSIRVISCAEWMSCLTGCGLRGSWALETQWAGAADRATLPPPQRLMSGSLNMPTKDCSACLVVMYRQAPECNKEISCSSCRWGMELLSVCLMGWEICVVGAHYLNL